jgi:hypothetical protein
LFFIGFPMQNKRFVTIGFVCWCVVVFGVLLLPDACVVEISKVQAPAPVIAYMYIYIYTHTHFPFTPLLCGLASIFNFQLQFQN